MNINIFTRRSRQKGMTLIEMMLAVALLTVILAALFTSLTSSQKAYNFGMSELTLQETANRVVGQITEKIRESSANNMIRDLDNGLWITLQKPVDHDLDNDVFDLNWNVEYGERYGGADHLGAYCTISYEVVGNDSRIKFSYYDNNAVLQSEKVVCENLIFPIDEDGDGVDEHIFTRINAAEYEDSDGNCIKLRFIILATDQAGLQHQLEFTERKKTAIIIHLRNP